MTLSRRSAYCCPSHRLRCNVLRYTFGAPSRKSPPPPPPPGSIVRRGAPQVLLLNAASCPSSGGGGAPLHPTPLWHSYTPFLPIGVPLRATTPIQVEVAVVPRVHPPSTSSAPPSRSTYGRARGGGDLLRAQRLILRPTPPPPTPPPPLPPPRAHTITADAYRYDDFIACTTRFARELWARVSVVFEILVPVSERAYTTV